MCSRGPETRTSIFGQWKLNLDESDDPRKKMQDASTSRGSGSRGSSGVSIAGFPIGGHPGSRGGESDEERLRTQNAISPANSLTLAQKDSKNPEVDLTDDQNRKQALFTDGQKDSETGFKGRDSARGCGALGRVAVGHGREESARGQDEPYFRIVFRRHATF